MNLGMEWIRRWRYRDLLVLCLFVLAGITIYVNSLGNPFHYDDQHYIEDNRNIRTLENIPRFFTNPRTIAADPQKAGHYRPLVVTSYAINYAIGGLNPMGYHLVNLAFHAGSAFLVFLIVQSLSLHLYAALAAGLIFLVHPFNSEVVNYLTARSSVMSGFFYLMGFYCWVRFREQTSGNYRSAVFYMASIFAFALGMLSKEVVITLPIVLWLYDLYFGERRHTLLNWRKYIPYLPFILIVAIPYLIMRTSSFGGVLTHFRRGIGTQIFTELPVLVKYWKLFILPTGLNIDHYVETYRTFFTLPVTGSAIVLILLIAVALLSCRSKAKEWKMISFFTIWFFVVMLPTTLIPLNAILQENRGYLAVVTFSVFAGIMLSKLEIPSSKGRLPLAAIIILLLIYGSATVYRNSIWKDGLTLWGDAARKSPGSPRAYSNLGTALARSGENDMAARSFIRALELANPESGVDPLNIHYNLGSVYQQMGRPELAVREYRVVTELNPDDPRPYYNLGVIYQQRHEPAAAIEAYKKVLERNPSDFRTYHNLGLLYQNRRDFVLAVESYKNAIRLNPDYEKSRFNLGVIYEMGGDSESARDAYIATLKLNPDYLPAYYNLGMIYEKEGNLDMAINVYKEAAKRSPVNQTFSGRIKSLEVERDKRR